MAQDVSKKNNLCMTLSIGVALFILWVFIDQQLLAPMASQSDTSNAGVTQILQPLILCVVAAILIPLAKSNKKYLFNYPALLIGSGIIGIAGIILERFVGGDILFIIGSMLTIVFFCIHFCYWTARLTECVPKTAVLCSLVAMATACGFLCLKVSVNLTDDALLVCTPAVLAVLSQVVSRLPHPSGEEVPAYTEAKEPVSGALIPCTIFVFVCALLNVAYVLSTTNRPSGSSMSQTILYLVPLIFFVIATALYLALVKLDFKKSELILLAFLCLYIICNVFTALFIGAGLDRKATMSIISIRIATEGVGFLVLAHACSQNHFEPLEPAVLFLLIVLGLPRALKVVLVALANALGFQVDALGLLFMASAVFALITLCVAFVLALRKDNGTEPTSTSDITAIAAEPASSTSPKGKEPLASRAKETLTKQYALTEREMDVVTCLYQRLDTKEAAEALFISTSTLYTHQKNIYRKLDVHSRKELVTLLEEL